MSRVIVVGAGVTGLTVAHRLLAAAPGTDVTVLEQAGRVGGAVWTEHADGFTAEAGRVRDRWDEFTAVCGAIRQPEFVR